MTMHALGSTSLLSAGGRARSAGRSMKTPRSAEWYAGTDRNTYLHRAWMRRGLPAHAFDGRPHIAIANTASDLNPCNTHLDEIAASVKQGVYEAGGIPLDLPVVSLGETQVRPTAMLWRNMAAMVVEELLRANPIDGAVLLGGCDKTIPSLIMGAASVDLPAVFMSGGPMLNGTFCGQVLGCGTDVWRLSEEVRAEVVSEDFFVRSESSMIRSRGHCNTMGTASSMSLVKGNAAEVIAAMEIHAACKDWAADDGKYIPHASTWLNQHRWTAEVVKGARVMGSYIIHPASFYEKAVLENFYPSGGKLPGFSFGWDCMKHIRVRPAELSVWAGINGHGKSMIVSQVALMAALAGEKTAIASFEMPAHKTLSRMVLQATGDPQPSQQAIRDCLAWLSQYVHIYDHVGRGNVTQMLENFEDMLRNRGNHPIHH